MLLLVPLMRVQSHLPLLVLSRRRPAETARRVSSPDSGDTEEASSFDSDPFLAMSDFVHDVRIVPARKYTAIDERGQPLEKHPDTSYHCFLDGKLVSCVMPLASTVCITHAVVYTVLSSPFVTNLSHLLSRSGGTSSVIGSSSPQSALSLSPSPRHSSPVT